MRRFLKKLYPDHDELAIFTMAVGVIALAILDPAFRAMLSTGAHILLVVNPAEGFQEGTWHGIKLLFGGVVLVSITILSLYASLHLPFTQRNLDVFVAVVVIAHSMLITAGNFLLWQSSQDPVSGLFAIGSLLWFFGFCLYYRYGDATISTTAEQATARQALIATASVALLLAAASVGFGVHWAHCYAIAAAYAVGLTKLVDRMA